MYNPLGLGSFPMGAGGMSGSPFGNLGQGSLLNGLDGSGGSGNKKSGSSGASKQSSSNPLLAAGLAGLNIPSLSKKDLKELAAMSAAAQNYSKSGGGERGGKGDGRGSSSKEFPLAAMLSHAQSQLPSQQQSMGTGGGGDNDSDDESLKSLMGNHQDELPDDDPTPDENAERIVLRGKGRLEASVYF